MAPSGRYSRVISRVHFSWLADRFLMIIFLFSYDRLVKKLTRLRKDSWIASEFFFLWFAIQDMSINPRPCLDGREKEWLTCQPLFFGLLLIVAAGVTFITRRVTDWYSMAIEKKPRKAAIESYPSIGFPSRDCHTHWRKKKKWQSQRTFPY